MIQMNEPWEKGGRQQFASEHAISCKLNLYIERPKPLKCHTEHEKGFPKKMSLILTYFHYIVLGSMLNLQGVAWCNLLHPGAGAVQHHRQEQHLVPRAPLGVDICGANFWGQKQKLRNQTCQVPA